MNIHHRNDRSGRLCPSPIHRRVAFLSLLTCRSMTGLVFVGLALFTGCSEKVDTHVELVELARVHERNDRLPEAAAAYRKALELDDKVATTWYDLGVTYDAMDQLPEAAEAYSKALELDPGLSLAYNNRAAVYARLKQFEQALADCDKAVALEPRDSVAWRNRGLANHDLGNLRRAIEDYDESIRLNGQAAATYHHRGNVYLELGQTERAIEDFRHALHLDPELGISWLSLAEAQARLGKRDEAEKSLAEAVRLGAELIDLDQFDPGVAPVADAENQEAEAVQFVQTQLGDKDVITANQAPWDLVQHGDGDSGDVWYVVRLVGSDGSVTIDSTELKALQKATDRVTHLVAVRRTQDSQSAFEVVRTIENWKPNPATLQPVAWSVAITDEASAEHTETAHPQSLSAK